jgi:hypothetical protein
MGQDGGRPQLSDSHEGEPQQEKQRDGDCRAIRLRKQNVVEDIDSGPKGCGGQNHERQESFPGRLEMCWEGFGIVMKYGQEGRGDRGKKRDNHNLLDHFADLGPHRVERDLGESRGCMHELRD